MTKMNDSSTNQSRRRFVVSTGGAIGVAALAGLLSRTANAADLPHLSLADPMAKALGYTEDSTKVANPKHTAGASCTNCNFYKGAAGAAFGPCLLFPKNDVNAKGWCTSYVKKP